MLLRPPSEGLISASRIGFFVGCFFAVSGPEAASAACSGIDPVALTLCNTSGFANATSSVGTTFGTEFLGVQFPLVSGSATQSNQFGYGVWSRGFVDQDTTRTTVSANGTSIAGSTRADSQGLQFGFDVGKFDIEATNWNVQVGLTGGSMWLKPDTAGNGSLNFSVPFVGGYITATNGGFFSQTQLLRGFMSGNISNAGANLSNVSTPGNVVSWSGLVGYHFELSDWSVEPTGGFSWTRLTVSSLNLGGGQSAVPVGTISYRPIDSDLGYIGVRLGHSFDFTTFTFNPYVSASLWNDFNQSGSATFNCALCNSGVALSSTRVGTFGQFSLGSTTSLTGTGLLGFARADFKAGDNIHGWTLTGGLRYTF